ncbi:putative SAM dependent methyltransferase [Heterostelium album PN500]|uniref:Putative SAM dependent methyltransferase n=1 Tax=Heterostelium pallidum (strain ATCC 26659 / Pp 5 / PN500) TaxID=670386 RepID=D3BDA8_HETP5|nr:putative SAM dependent methyltransferase [Heterostelium album PN500]EFA80552.1 putative SAM dependent methyltransferase [Heterostelium album PN500]|eukprot:XP_020432672.1 putative SAM dependent methyltransferase [Heterostelium album PN500]
MTNTANEIHPTAKGYHNVETTNNYLKGRPTLPLETIDYIRNNIKLTADSKILDLAAGTGKFTQLLADHGGFNDIIAVEPSPEFRDACTQVLTAIQKEQPNRSDLKFQVLDGTATSIPMPDESVDALFVSQAFHWFSNEESLREMIRVLKRGAPLILVWCDMDVSNPIVRDAAAIFHEKYYDGVTPQFRSYKWKSAFENESLSNIIDTDLHLERFRFDQKYTRDTLINRILSVSYVSLFSDEKKKQLIAEVDEALAKHPETINSSFNYPYNVELYYTFKK